MDARQRAATKAACFAAVMIRRRQIVTPCFRGTCIQPSNAALFQAVLFPRLFCLPTLTKAAFAVQF